MIPLFFYKRFTIDSPLSHEEAVKRLSEEVAPQRGFNFGFETRQELFEGLVSKGEFQIFRTIWYRNSFLPMLYGRFYPSETGLRIRVVMTLHPLILIIMVGLGLSASEFMLPILYQLITTGIIDDWLRKPAVIIAFVYVVCALCFGIEANIASRLLKQLLEANPPSEAAP